MAKDGLSTSTKALKRIQLPAGRRTEPEMAVELWNPGDKVQYLIEKHDLTDAGDSLRVESRVRSILAVSSRRELNTDPNAAARWKSLRADYDAWRNYP
jgi:hypothetical protein